MNFLDIKKVEIVFKQDEKLKTTELSNYLYNLKIVYTYLYENQSLIRDYLNWEYCELQQKNEEIKDKIIKSIKSKKLGRFYKYNFFRKKLDEKDLYIEAMDKKSPLTIWFIGVASLLILAFIISGGTLDLSILPPRIKIKMPPISKGLKSLKDIFRRKEL